MTSSEIEAVSTSETAPVALTVDGFHLLIDSLKLNGLDTIYGLPGIPITDWMRLARQKDCVSSRFDTSKMQATLQLLRAS